MKGRVQAIRLAGKDPGSQFSETHKPSRPLNAEELEILARGDGVAGVSQQGAEVSLTIVHATVPTYTQP